MLIDTTSISDWQDTESLVLARSGPPLWLLDLQYSDKSFDSSKISVSATSIDFNQKKVNKAEILSSIFPGVRQMTEEESEEYEAFLDAYFD